MPTAAVSAFHIGPILLNIFRYMRKSDRAKCLALSQTAWILGVGVLYDNATENGMNHFIRVSNHSVCFYQEKTFGYTDFRLVEKDRLTKYKRSVHRLTLNASRIAPLPSLLTTLSTKYENITSVEVNCYFPGMGVTVSMRRLSKGSLESRGAISGEENGMDNGRFENEGNQQRSMDIEITAAEIGTETGSVATGCQERIGVDLHFFQTWWHEYWHVANLSDEAILGPNS